MDRITRALEALEQLDDNDVREVMRSIAARELHKRTTQTTQGSLK